MPRRPVRELEPAVAIGAFDEGLVAHLEEHARMTQRAANAVAADAGGVDFDDLGRIDGHGHGSLERRRIIAAGPGTATLGYKALMFTLNRIYTKTGDKGETARGYG